METQEKTVEVNLPADLAKRFAEATTNEQRMGVLNEFAQSRGAQNQTEQASFHMSKEQFSGLLERMGEISATQAKAAVESVTGEIEQRYAMNKEDAKRTAEKAFESAHQRHVNQRQDNEMIHRVFQGMWLAKCGQPDALARIREEEAKDYQKRYGRDIRSMSLGTDSTGGYLAPQLFSDMLYDNIARSSLVRQHATIIQMNGNEVINIPVKSSTVSAAQISELSGATTSQAVFTQKQLGTKKIVSMVRPMSVELLEKSNPAIIPIIMQDAMDQIMIKEDELVFGTSGNGLRANTTNDITKGSAATGYSSITFDHLIDMESELDPQYLGDKYILGSGMLGGAPRYYLPHHLRQELKKKTETGTGAYLDEAKELRNTGKIFGYEACTTLSLPTSSALAENDKIAIFGNLARVFVGLEGGFRILINETGKVDNGGSDVDLYSTGAVSIRVISFFDNVVVDEEGFSKIKIAA